MNYLAHAFLSRGHSEILAGNYLADLLTKKETDLLPMALQQGVQLHRVIDSYTDQHPSVRACTRILHSTIHKYAPVIADIYFDYLLGKHWSTFATVSLDEFIRKTYRQLQTEAGFPEQYRYRLNRMIDDDWLSRSSSYKNLERTFAYLQKRASFKANFHLLTRELKRNEDELSSHFMMFFPEVIEVTSTWMLENILDI